MRSIDGSSAVRGVHSQITAGWTLSDSDWTMSPLCGNDQHVGLWDALVPSLVGRRDVTTVGDGDAEMNVGPNSPSQDRVGPKSVIRNLTHVYINYYET